MLHDQTPRVSITDFTLQVTARYFVIEAVIDEHDDDMRFTDCIVRIVDKTNVLVTRKCARQFLGIRFRDKHLAVFPACDGFSDLQRRAFTKIVNVRLERKAEQRDLGSGAHSLRAGYRRLDLFKDIGRLAVIHLAGGADEPGLRRSRRYNEPGVHGNAMAANARTGLKNIHARVMVGEANKLPDVDPEFLADHRQLIGESDTDIPKGIFRQLAHFRGAHAGLEQVPRTEDSIQLFCAS